MKSLLAKNADILVTMDGQRREIKCADFFSINLNTVDFSGALNDPVAATVFCAPQKAQHMVINGRVIVQDGKCVTVDLPKIVEEHNKHSISMATAAF